MLKLLLRAYLAYTALWLHVLNEAVNDLLNMIAITRKKTK